MQPTEITLAGAGDAEGTITYGQINLRKLEQGRYAIKEVHGIKFPAGYPTLKTENMPLASGVNVCPQLQSDGGIVIPRRPSGVYDEDISRPRNSLWEI